MKPKLALLFWLIATMASVQSKALDPANDFRKFKKRAQQNIQDAGKTIEKGFQKIGDAGADIITLGENGRRRDRDRAEHDLALAQQEKTHAEGMRQQTLLSLQLQLADSQTVLDLAQRFNSFLTLANLFIEKNIANAVLAAELQGTNSLAFATQQDLMRDHFQGIENWFNQILLNIPQGSENQRSELERYRTDLKIQLSNYLAQFDAVEKVTASEVDQKSIDRLFQSGCELLHKVEKELIINQHIISTMTQAIESLNTQIQTVQHTNQ